MKVARICGGILLLANLVCAQGPYSAITGYGTTPLDGYSAFVAGPAWDTVGWSFTTSQNLEVTGLGCAPGDGLGSSPITTPANNELEVGLWSGDGILLASAFVDLASASPFTTISPVLLQASNLYVIGGWPGNESVSGGPVVFGIPLEPMTSPQIEPVDVAESPQDKFSFPVPFASVSSGQSQGTRLPMANFQFETTTCPVILNNSTNFGGRPGGFSFSVCCTSNATIIVEASTNLAAPTWCPLQTNTVVSTNGAFNFIDPEWTNYPNRFYRIVAQ